MTTQTVYAQGDLVKLDQGVHGCLVLFPSNYEMVVNLRDQDIKSFRGETGALIVASRKGEEVMFFRQYLPSVTVQLEELTALRQTNNK